MQIERSLILGVDRREVSVGETITVRVRDRSNRPIEDAIVEAGSKRRRTDSHGRCTLTIHSPGFWKLTARKRPTERVAYKPANVLVRAVPGSRGTTDRRRRDPPVIDR